MSRLKIASLATAFALFASQNALAAESPAFEASYLFQSTCLSSPTLTVSDAFLKEAKHVKPISSLSAALDFGLNTNSAYQSTRGETPVAVAVTKDMKCTVSVQNVDPAKIRAQLLMGQPNTEAAKDISTTGSGWTQKLELTPPQANYETRHVTLTYDAAHKRTDDKFGMTHISLKSDYNRLRSH